MSWPEEIPPEEEDFDCGIPKLLACANCCDSAASIVTLLHLNMHGSHLNVRDLSNKICNSLWFPADLQHKSCDDLWIEWASESSNCYNRWTLSHWWYVIHRFAPLLNYLNTHCEKRIKPRSRFRNMQNSPAMHDVTLSRINDLRLGHLSTRRYKRNNINITIYWCDINVLMFKQL